jgi:hypothetical protein
MTFHGKEATGLLTAARVDVPSVAGAIRDELRRRNVNWFQLEADLELAEENVLAGYTLPEMPYLRGVAFRVTRFLVKCLFRLARPITCRQRRYNAAVLSGLYGVIARVRRAEEEQAPAVGAALARLEARLAEQEARIGELEAALAAARARPAA